MDAKRVGKSRLTLIWCLLLGFCGADAVSADKRSELPDWSGWWVLESRVTDEMAQAPPPLKPEDLARYWAARRNDSNPDPGRFCRPPQFTGYSGGFTEAVEFLFTPGRVTLANEAGLIRRIYTDGRSLPTVPESTNTGTSVGRWEGHTLIVETVGINPAALYPLHTTHGAMRIGKNARITERMSLQSPDKLRFDIVIVAPEIFVAPDRRTRIYSRVPGKTTVQEFNLCVDHDRQIDPETGSQRFDLTPPQDLPPPPAPK